MQPILKQKCSEAFQAGFEKGLAKGWENKLLSYENEIEFYKRFFKKERHLLSIRWISVDERLPTAKDADKAGDVLVYCYCGYAGVWRWDDVESHTNLIGYWMPLPKPPKELDPAEGR